MADVDVDGSRRGEPVSRPAEGKVDKTDEKSAKLKLQSGNSKEKPAYLWELDEAERPMTRTKKSAKQKPAVSIRCSGIIELRKEPSETAYEDSISGANLGKVVTGEEVRLHRRKSSASTKSSRRPPLAHTNHGFHKITTVVKHDSPSHFGIPPSAVVSPPVPIRPRTVTVQHSPITPVSYHAAYTSSGDGNGPYSSASALYQQPLAPMPSYMRYAAIPEPSYFAPRLTTRPLSSRFDSTYDSILRNSWAHGSCDPSIHHAIEDVYEESHASVPDIPRRRAITRELPDTTTPEPPPPYSPSSITTQSLSNGFDPVTRFRNRLSNLGNKPKGHSQDQNLKEDVDWNPGSVSLGKDEAESKKESDSRSTLDFPGFNNFPSQSKLMNGNIDALPEDSNIGIMNRPELQEYEKWDAIPESLNLRPSSQADTGYGSSRPLDREYNEYRKNPSGSVDKERPSLYTSPLSHAGNYVADSDSHSEQISKTSRPASQMGNQVDNKSFLKRSLFRTDSEISGGRNQRERTLQKWVPDTQEDSYNSLETGRMRTAGGTVWPQFAENEKRFGLTTDYSENIYTTTIDKTHPQYKQRLAEAERKAREVERSSTIDFEEDKYSEGCRQDPPPLSLDDNPFFKTNPKWMEAVAVGDTAVSQANNFTSSPEDLQTDERRKILDHVTQVRTTGLEEALSLPHLVVSGDQPAGKSSVIEALTEAPFTPSSLQQVRPTPRPLCDSCVIAKIRCSMTYPCARCKKHNVECIYGSSLRIRNIPLEVALPKKVESSMATERDLSEGSIGHSTSISGGSGRMLDSTSYPAVPKIASYAPLPTNVPTLQDFGQVIIPNKDVKFASDKEAQAWRSRIPELGSVPILQPVFMEPSLIQMTLVSLEGGPMAVFLEKLLVYGRKPLPQNTKRLVWTCRCGHKSYDDFQELKKGGIAEFAARLLDSGYITNAQISNQTSGKLLQLTMRINNIFVGAQRRIDRFRSSLLPVFSKPASVKSMALHCLPAQNCRWLHLCFKKRPYATKLSPLHVCKDEDQKEYTDASLFQALRKAYYSQRSWTEKMVFKLKRIEFIEFELCPDDLVDGILPDKLPPTTDEYDFQPPPPLKKVPPIGPEHMMHLFTTCSAPPLDTSLYLRHIPKRKNEALCFHPDKVEGNTGWGLHFVEKVNSSLAVTVMFVVSLILGIAFAVCWSIWRKDIQGAFGVAAYVTSVMTLAVMTWQMWTV